MSQQSAMSQDRPRGFHFEEFEEGVELVTAARTITEPDIQLFAGLTGDYTQLHTDVEFCKDTIFGQRVADIQLAIFAIAHKQIPLIQHIDDRCSSQAVLGDPILVLAQPFFEVIKCRLA